MIRGYGAQAVRDAEAPALAAGRPLMRNAAFALATQIAANLRARETPLPGARALVLVGGGNNGGDGLFAAADLRARGMQVTCLLAHARPHPDGLAAARRAGSRIIDLTQPPQRREPSIRPVNLEEPHTGNSRTGEPETQAPGTREPGTREPETQGPGTQGAGTRDLDTEQIAHWGRWADVWVDALAGIGVQGALRDLPARVVAVLAGLRHGSPVDPLVVAVDTPSGVGADPAQEPIPDDGVLTADLTITMGAPKAGLLLPPGAHHAGRLHVVDLGLTEDFTRQQPAVHRLTATDVVDLWPLPQTSDHKYTRGVVGLYAGSAQYPGAALLSAGAAAGVGVGMVRYLGHPDVAAEVVRAHPEVVSAAGRVQSQVIGPGMAPDDDELAAAMQPAVRRWGLEPGAPATSPAHGSAGAEELPADGADAAREAATGGPGGSDHAGGSSDVHERVAVVLDAGALDHLPDAPEALAGHPVVLTPHAGELQRLLNRLGIETGRADIESDPWRWAHTAAARTGTTVLLKGPITVIAPPEGVGYAQPDGSPWLATAGSGDVLAGILGAMLAQATEAELDSDVAARVAAAVVVHGRAAELAGAPLRASHLARAVPDAIASLLGP